MPIFTQRPSEFDVSLSELPSSRSEALSATFQDSLRLSPSPSIARTLELRRAKGEDIFEPVESLFLKGLPGGQVVDFVADLFNANKAERAMVSVDDANKRGESFGLQFEEPITEDALDILVERKIRERALSSTIERGPSGFFFTPLKLATSFVAQAVDPINIASAFIPVTNSIKFFQVAKSTNRLLRGATEGLVGAAIVEPFVGIAADEEQADYGMMDSLINVGFGGILGGGLHVAGGKFADYHKKRTKVRQENEDVADILLGQDPKDPPPLPEQAKVEATVPDRIQAGKQETHMDTTHSAMAQMLDGRKVDVGGMMDLDPATKNPFPTEAERAAQLDPRKQDVQAEAKHQADQHDNPTARRGTSERVSQQADEAIPEQRDLNKPEDVETIAREAEEQLKEATESLDEGGVEALAILDEEIKKGGEDIGELKTGEQIEALEVTAKRKQSFISKLADCVVKGE